jgi:hypothetical protein
MSLGWAELLFDAFTTPVATDRQAPDFDYTSLQQPHLRVPENDVSTKQPKRGVDS